MSTLPNVPALFPSFAFHQSALNWSTGQGVGTVEFTNENSTVTPFQTFTVTPLVTTTWDSTFGYNTTINAVSDKKSQGFWSTVALTVSQNALRSKTVTDICAGDQEEPADLSVAVWGTLLLMIGRHPSREPEQRDIINVIESALPTRKPENRISPANLLRACAVGASISEALAEQPHIYSAPHGRIVLDYALDDGRFTAIVTDEYVHLLGTVRGHVRDRSIASEKYDLLELKNWIEAE